MCICYSLWFIQENVLLVGGALYAGKKKGAAGPPEQENKPLENPKVKKNIPISANNIFVWIQPPGSSETGKIETLEETSGMAAGQAPVLSVHCSLPNKDELVGRTSKFLPSINNEDIVICVPY